MLGYDVPEVRDAVERQLGTGVVHTSTLYLIRHQVELAEKIARLSGIENAKVFFTNSGSEANEVALLAALTARQANEVLAMRGSYHGRSFGTVAVTGNAAWKMSSHSPFGTHYLHGADRQLNAYRDLDDAGYIEACVDRTCGPCCPAASIPPTSRACWPSRCRAWAGSRCRPTACSRRTRRSWTSTASC